MLDYLCKISDTNDVSLNVKPIFLFTNSMNDNYNCADILVRLMAIDCYYGKNDYGFDIYNEMQRKRVLENPNVPNERAYNQKRFEDLIKSFEKNGFISKYPLQVNKDMEFLDGSHRLSLALYYHIHSIPVYFSESRLYRKIDYSLNWFKKEGIQKYIPIILEKYNKLMEEYKENYIVIIYANNQEYEKYKEIISKNKEILIQSSEIILDENLLLLKNKYGIFLEENQKDIRNRNYYMFNIKMNYKIRKIKIVNDKIEIIYDEFNIDKIPYMVISNNN